MRIVSVAEHVRHFSVTRGGFRSARSAFSWWVIGMFCMTCFQVIPGINFGFAVCFLFRPFRFDIDDSNPGFRFLVGGQGHTDPLRSRYSQQHSRPEPQSALTGPRVCSGPRAFTHPAVQRVSRSKASASTGTDSSAPRYRGTFPTVITLTARGTAATR